MSEIIFVITQKEIDYMLKMAKEKNDNLFVHVTTGSLGAHIRIMPQYPTFKIDPKSKDWVDITDYESI
jgi:hypothetical protein